MLWTDGLWAFWRLGESHGTTRLDSSGNSRHLTDHGDVGAVPSAAGRGAVFAGVAGQSLWLAETLPLGSFSVSLWVQALFVHPYSPGVFWGQGAGSQTHQKLFARASDYHFAVQDESGTWVPRQEVPALTLRHLVATYDADDSRIRIYLNGAYRGTLAGEVLTSGATTTALGSCPDGSAQNFKGTLSLCGLWTRVLSGDEVTALYAGGQGLDPTA